MNDHLEEDDYNVQWSQNDQTFPDDYLKNLPGSTDSPELARTLTYNVYATKVRAYKQPQSAGGGADHRGLRARAPGAFRRRQSSMPTRT